MPDHTGLVPKPAALRVRDLLCQFGHTYDRVERATLLTRLADALEKAASEITEHAVGRDRAAVEAAGLRGQASMARIAAELQQTNECGCLAQAT